MADDFEKFDQRSAWKARAEPLVKQLVELARELNFPLIIAAVTAFDGEDFDALARVVLNLNRCPPQYLAAIECLKPGALGEAAEAKAAMKSGRSGTDG